MKPDICMRLPCEECGKVYDIPTDKYDDYNIYRKWDGVGSAVMSRLCLLCPPCTKHWSKKARKEA